MTGAFEFSRAARPFFSSGLMSLWDGREKSMILKGAITLSHGNVKTAEQAAIMLIVRDDWMIFPPSVRAYDSWVKNDINWHASGPGNFVCYVFDGYWRFHLNNMSRSLDREDLLIYASKWCMDSVAWLLYRHLYAFEQGLSEWNKGWGGWPHDRQEAWAEFEELKVSKKI